MPKKKKEGSSHVFRCGWNWTQKPQPNFVLMQMTRLKSLVATVGHVS